MVADDVGVVNAVDRKSDQRDTGDEGVAGLAVFFIVRGAVEFDGSNDAGRFGREQMVAGQIRQPSRGLF